jgi:hypothetical protein
MQAEYSDMEVESVEVQLADGPAVGYDLMFWCLDFVVAAQLRAFRRGHATYFVTYQAEEREYGRLQHVFEAMTHSLLNDGQRLEP